MLEGIQIATKDQKKLTYLQIWKEGRNKGFGKRLLIEAEVIIAEVDG